MEQRFLVKIVIRKPEYLEMILKRNGWNLGGKKKLRIFTKGSKYAKIGQSLLDGSN